MSMSKKDYETLANVIRPQYGTPQQGLFTEERMRTLDSLVDSLADALERDNPQFLRDRFLTAATPVWHREDRGLEKPERSGPVRRPTPGGF